MALTMVMTMARRGRFGNDARRVIVIVTVTLRIALALGSASGSGSDISFSFFVLLVRHLVVHSGLHCGDRDVFLSYVIAYPKYANIDFDQVISVCDNSVFDSPRFD